MKESYVMGARLSALRRRIAEKPMVWVAIGVLGVLGCGVFFSGSTPLVNLPITKPDSSQKEVHLTYKNELLEQTNQKSTIDSSNYNQPHNAESSDDDAKSTLKSPWPDVLPPPAIQSLESSLQPPGQSSRPTVQPTLPHHAP